MVLQNVGGSMTSSDLSIASRAKSTCSNRASLSATMENGSSSGRRSASISARTSFTISRSSTSERGSCLQAYGGPASKYAPMP